MVDPQQPARLPYLKITVSGSNGTDPEKPLGNPVTVRTLPEIPVRIAAMYMTSALVAEMRKKFNFQDALKAIGLK